MYSYFLIISLLFATLALTVAKKDINEDFYASFADDRHYESIVEANKKMRRRIFEERANFTTCPEFLNNTQFDINKLLNVEWQIFYYYTDSNIIIGVPHVFNFRLSDPMLVLRFQSEMNRTMRHPVHLLNWTAAELFLDTNMEFSAVLLATNKSGMYDIIPSVHFEGKLYADEECHIGMRFVEPHFLGFMNCEYRQLLVLAPVNKMPKKEEERAMANLFKFRSNFGVGLSDIIEILKKEESRTIGLLHEEDDRDLNIIYEEDDQHEMINMI